MVVRFGDLALELLLVDLRIIVLASLDPKLVLLMLDKLRYLPIDI